MYKGIAEGLEKNKIEYETFFYPLVNWEEDEEFLAALEKKVQDRRFDAVFSINYNPLITLICKKHDIPYISWVYDSPMHIRKLEPLKENCNYCFSFDRGFVDAMNRDGYPMQYHILAGDTSSFFDDKIKEYKYDISMVGNSYQTEYAHYMSPLSAKDRGYLEGILAAQSKLNGAYILPELIDTSLLERLNQQYEKASQGEVHIEKRELEFLLAREITRRERLSALTLLGNHYQVDWFTGDEQNNANGLHVHPAIGYYQEMPQVFSSSKINLNISLKTIYSGIPLRVFDILASGGFLITNYQSELEQYFTPGKELIVYHNLEELYMLVEYYMKHDEQRCQIAKNGYQKVRSRYSFEVAIREIFTGVLGSK